ncbi:MAG: zinc-dependent metalloprotease [Acidimicrobiales bacterium]
MADAVAWDLAARVAARVGGREPGAPFYVHEALQADFEELTAEAEGLVTAATGLRSFAGPARARVTDRKGWVNANIASFRRLLAPLLGRLEARLDETDSSVLTRAIQPVGRVVTATQIGTLLGWMSTRVIGQYDLLLMEDDSPEDQDIVYYVGPNVLQLEKRFDFPTREFRLWVALHEVTHRAQFTGVPWMREHFLSLVEGSLAAADPDPKRFVEALKKAIDLVRAGRNPLDDGLIALLATPEQAEVLDRVQGLMSLLEGHGDVTMDRAAIDRIPSASRFSEVLRARRQQASVPARFLQQLIGLEAKLRQYEEGERFIATVEQSGGPSLLARVWEAPDRLPALGEIREPVRWIDRMRRTPVAGWQPGVAAS